MIALFLGGGQDFLFTAQIPSRLLSYNVVIGAVLMGIRYCNVVPLFAGSCSLGTYPHN